MDLLCEQCAPIRIPLHPHQILVVRNTDVHDVDVVIRRRIHAHELPAYRIAAAHVVLPALQRRDDERLHIHQTKPQRKQLGSERFAGTGCPDDDGVCVWVRCRVEHINGHQRVVVLVGADHDTFLVLHLIGDERITGAGSGRQDVAACFSLHIFVQRTDRNHTGKAFLHHKSRPADHHALSLYALFQLSVFVFQLVKTVCNYREQSRQIIEILAAGQAEHHIFAGGNRVQPLVIIAVRIMAFGRRRAFEFHLHTDFVIDILLGDLR